MHISEARDKFGGEMAIGLPAHDFMGRCFAQSLAENFAPSPTYAKKNYPKRR